MEPVALPPREDAELCDAGWMTDHSDTYYGLYGRCDLPVGHDGPHSGTVTTWDGDREHKQEGVRLTWPTVPE